MPAITPNHRVSTTRTCCRVNTTAAISSAILSPSLFSRYLLQANDPFSCAIDALRNEENCREALGAPIRSGSPGGCWITPVSSSSLEGIVECLLDACGSIGESWPRCLQFAAVITAQPSRSRERLMVAADIKVRVHRVAVITSVSESERRRFFPFSFSLSLSLSAF